MTWAALIPLIAQYGLPWVYQFYQIVTKHPDPTDEAWDKLLALSQMPMLDYVNAARAKIGLPPLTSYDPRVDPGAPSRPAPLENPAGLAHLQNPDPSSHLYGSP